jgi:hypothetical protein
MAYTRDLADVATAFVTRGPRMKRKNPFLGNLSRGMPSTKPKGGSHLPTLRIPMSRVQAAVQAVRGIDRMLLLNLAGTSSWSSGCASKPDSTHATTLSTRPISCRSKTCEVVADIQDRARCLCRKSRVLGEVRPPWGGRRAMDEVLDFLAMEEEELTLRANWKLRERSPCKS